MTTSPALLSGRRTSAAPEALDQGSNSGDRHTEVRPAELGQNRGVDRDDAAVQRYFGFKAVENPVHVHDLHATILYLMGIDHEKLTYKYSGRDFRLTDVAGNVIHDIIA